MTVSTEVDHNDYIGNSVTTVFPYQFRIFKAADLTVVTVDLDETQRELILGTDYTVTGAGSYQGGNVVLASALANGWQISIARELPVTQETDLRNQGKFFAEVHENAFDKLTMLIQQTFSRLSLALRKPSFIANYYDALNNRIRNLRDPSQSQDAATKNYVDSLANTNLSKTLRTPEAISQLPTKEFRYNKLISFDANGNPLLVPPADGSASDIWAKLSSWEVMHYAASLSAAKILDVRIGDKVNVNGVFFDVVQNPPVNSRLPLIVCDNGYFLSLSEKNEIDLNGSLIPFSFLDFTQQSTYVPGSSGSNLAQGLQGIEIDNVNNRAFVFQIDHSSSNPETGSMFEYDFSAGNFGSVLKESHHHVMGHGDHFAIEIKEDGSRRIWFTRPTDNTGSWSPSTLCIMDWDVPDPESTIKILYSFNFYVGIGWYDSTSMYLLTHTEEQYICERDDLLVGIFNPKEVVNSKDANIALVRNPKQQLKHFLGNYVACSGGDASNKKEAYVAVGLNGIKTATMNIYTNGISISGTPLPWGEIEGLCWYWDAITEKYITLVGVTYPDLKGVWFFDVCSKTSNELIPNCATEFYQSEIMLPSGQDQGGSESGKVSESSVPSAVPQAFFGGWKVNEVSVGGIKYKLNYNYSDFYATQNPENYGTSYSVSAVLHGFNWDIKMYPVTDNRYGGALIIRSVKYNRNTINITENGCLELNLNYVKNSGYASAFQHHSNMMDGSVYRAGFHSRASVISLLNENALLTVGRYSGDIAFGYVSDYSSGVDQYLFRMNTNRFEPFTDNVKDLGSASTRFRVVYAGTGSINTSDANHKNGIMEIPDAVLDAWSEVEYKMFKFNDSVAEKGDMARSHAGLIAQDILSAFKKHGLNPFDYGVLCFDSWDDEYLPDGTKIKDAGNIYGVRYDEAMVLESALIRRELKKLIR